MRSSACGQIMVWGLTGALLLAPSTVMAKAQGKPLPVEEAHLVSSFHVIGEIFDNVYREADLISEPAHSVQTTLVPPGGATVVEFEIEKGAVGFLNAEGPPRHDIYVSQDDGVTCPGCLVHP